MLQTPRATRGMATSPHHLASQAALRVIQDGGNAIEAMVALAATIAVVYPHMNGLGGDNFWLMSKPGDIKPIGIDACGAAAAQADRAYYANHGFDQAIPSRGPKAALTVAGAVSGWMEALRVSATWGGTLPLARLLEDAIYYAENGAPVTRTQHLNTAAKQGEMVEGSGFHSHFLFDGSAPPEGSVFKQPALAATLKLLATHGLDSFYRGGLSKAIAADLERAGSPIALGDLERHQALEVTPLSLDVGGHKVFNMPPPTQGLASLMLLGVYDRLGVKEAEGFDFVHGLVESTKQSFRIRDAFVTDPAYMANPAETFLDPAKLDSMAASVDTVRAMPWPNPLKHGDTVWMAVMDGDGRAVSMIQSLFWEFGSGTVLSETGITWQNRGASFGLADNSVNRLEPGRRPFHTIQPAMAYLSDGRTLAYGTMGGEGQPQTQAMVFARAVLHGQPLQQAVTAPRWLLGKTWGADTTNLRVESRLGDDVITALKAAGHDVEVIGPFDEVMGHAGAILRNPETGVMEGATDPRSDGCVAAF